MMLFSTIRAILLFLGSVFTVYKIRISKIVKKKTISILLVVIFTILISVSGMFPVENLFVSFNSPESAFNYAKSGTIDDILYGEKSCMIVYSKKNSTGGHYFLTKTKKGYKLPTYFVSKKVSSEFDKTGFFDVYNISGTSDYYGFGTIDAREHEIQIYNDKNEKLETDVVVLKDSVFIYFVLNDFSDGYYILVNNEKFPIS